MSGASADAHRSYEHVPAGRCVGRYVGENNDRDAAILSALQPNAGNGTGRAGSRLTLDTLEYSTPLESSTGTSSNHGQNWEYSFFKKKS